MLTVLQGRSPNNSVTNGIYDRSSSMPRRHAVINNEGIAIMKHYLLNHHSIHNKHEEVISVTTLTETPS
jgi:hypothetical protein